MTTDLAVKGDVISDSVMTFEQMISACPNPTQSELRKMLAVQGYILNADGLKLREMALEGTVSPKKLNLALQFLRASREAIKAAASIEDETETINIPVDT